MNKAASSLPLLLEGSNLTNGGHLTLIRDATEACDSIPLVLNIAKTLNTATRTANPAPVALFLSTRSRSQYAQGDQFHLHPFLSRPAVIATAPFVPLDPYTMQPPDFATCPLDFQRRLTNSVIDTAQQHGLHLIVIECMHSLNTIFRINPSAFVRSLLSPAMRLSVLAACPTGCGIDDDIVSLSDIADSVCDLYDLQTGVATDVDGLIRVSKENGRWKPASQSRRYRVTDTSFKIYT